MTDKLPDALDGLGAVALAVVVDASVAELRHRIGRITGGAT